MGSDGGEDIDWEAFRAMTPEEADRRIATVKLKTEAQERIGLKRAQRFVPPVAFPLMTHLVNVARTPAEVGLYLTVVMEMRRLGVPSVRVQDNQLKALGLSVQQNRSRAVSRLETAGLLAVERRRGYASMLTALVPAELDIEGRAF